MALTQVKTNGIADDAVTLGKLDGGTDGNLITYDASGNPAVVNTGNSGQVLTSNGSGAAPTFQAASSGATINNATANELVTVASTTTQLDAESNLTFDGNNLTQTTDADGEGFILTTSGNTYNQITLDADRSSANNPVGAIIAKWDGNTIGSVQWNTGADTTNKDDGWFDLRTAEGGSNTERLRVAQDGTVTVAGHIKQDGGFGIMEPCFNATMGDDVACNDQTWTKNDRWQNSGTAMNPGWDSTNDKFTVPSGGAGHYLFIWTIQLGDGHQNHLDEEEILDTILRKNGTDIAKSKNRSPGTVNDWFHVTGSYSCELADADYIEMYHWHNEGGRLDIDDASCSFMGFRIAEGD